MSHTYTWVLIFNPFPLPTFEFETTDFFIGYFAHIFIFVCEVIESSQPRAKIVYVQVSCYWAFAEICAISMLEYAGSARLSAQLSVDSYELLAASLKNRK